MKITYAILKEYCPVSLEPKKLADLLTRHGLKVESISPVRDSTIGIIEESCGTRLPRAPAKAGPLAMTSLRGSGLPRSSLRATNGSEAISLGTGSAISISNGVDSQGDNAVFEFEVTANRPDCLSFIGIARETALITKAKSIGHREKKSKLSALRSTLYASFIQIKEPKLCPMYIGRIIRDVKVGPSPAWLRNHLESLGSRSINNIVDITNWVLLETGQPLHAFDLDKLAGGQVIVRTAVQGEKMTAIDAKTYALTPDMLVIADTQKPVALAGIMGGKDTEVTESTRNILLESAYFNPACIRRTSRFLALPTDSSYRFERIVDPKGVDVASQRATQLILEIAGGTRSDYQALDYLKYKDRKVALRTERISRILGITIPKHEIRRIVNGLGLEINKSSLKGFELLAPSFRPDLNLEIDVIEELARIYGYDRIPVTPPCIELNVAQEDKIYDVTRIARSHLVESGYNEALTNSFWDVEEIKRSTLIGLSAPDGTTDRYLRNNLVKGLIEVFNLNENYLHSESHKTIKLFEISKTYYRNNNSSSSCHSCAAPDVIPAKAGIQCGGNDKCGEKISVCERFSLGIIDSAGFYSLKGALAGLFNVLGLGNKISYANEIPATISLPHGIKNSVGINLDGNPIGYIGAIERDEAVIGVGELDLEALISQADLAKQYKPFIRLPAVTRDIAVVVPESTAWAQIEDISRRALTPSIQDVPLEKIEFFDIYRGKQVPAGHKSIAFSLTFRHPTRTLASEAVDGVVKTVVDALAKDLKACLR